MSVRLGGVRYRAVERACVVSAVCVSCVSVLVSLAGRRRRVADAGWTRSTSRATAPAPTGTAREMEMSTKGVWGARAARGMFG